MAQSSSTRGPIVMMVKPTIQFIQGTDELTVPDVRLTKSRDGTNGMAIFKFEQPSVFDSSGEVGDITGFYMIDEEGVITQFILSHGDDENWSYPIRMPMIEKTRVVEGVSQRSHQKPIQNPQPTSVYLALTW